jgi:plastocyanin
LGIFTKKGNVMNTRRRFRRFFIFLPVAFLAATLGCDQSTPSGSSANTRSDPPAAKTPAPAPAPSAAATSDRPSRPAASDVKPASGTAALVGVVRFNGEPPKRKPINFGPEKKCHEGHEGNPPLDETLVVSSNREVQWVTVRIAGKVPGNFAPPTQPAVLDQKGCVFLPHVLTVMSGQAIEVRNSDPVLHNVRCEATLNPGFNRNLPKPGDAMTVKFDTPEMGLKLKCDVHFWMAGVIHVMPHPFFAVTGADGTFTINNVPPGTHKLEAWHEKLGKLTQDVTVKEGESKTVEFVFNPK